MKWLKYCVQRLLEWGRFVPALQLRRPLVRNAMLNRRFGKAEISLMGDGDNWAHLYKFRVAGVMLWLGSDGSRNPVNRRI